MNTSICNGLRQAAMYEIVYVRFFCCESRSRDWHKSLVSPNLLVRLTLNVCVCVRERLSVCECVALVWRLSPPPSRRRLKMLASTCDFLAGRSACSLSVSRRPLFTANVPSNLLCTLSSLDLQHHSSGHSHHKDIKVKKCNTNTHTHTHAVLCK